MDSNLTGSSLFHVYTPGIDQSDASTGALHLMAEDALGTVRGFVNDNAAAAVTDTFGAFAFGAPRTRTGSDAFSLAWGGADGYQTDANGLVLMGNRVYHVYTGRFLTRDPAGAGSNDYEYANDSPVNEIDPSGLSPASINGSFGSVVGGDSGSWFLGDMFDSVYSPTGVNLSGRSVTGSTDYYLYEWLQAPGAKDWTFAGMSYLFTQYTLSLWAAQAGPSGLAKLWDETKTTASGSGKAIGAFIGVASGGALAINLWFAWRTRVDDMNSKINERKMLQSWLEGSYKYGDEEEHSANTDDLYKQYALFQSQWGEYATDAAKVAAETDRGAYGYGGH